MKNAKLFTVLAFLAVVIIACANEIPNNEVPSVVKNTLMVKYPEATDVEWEFKRHLYEVEFEVGNTDYEAWIDTTGTLLKVVKDISAAEVPQKIRTAVATDFKNQVIDDAEEIDIKAKKYYRLELEGTLGDHKVVYNSKGEREDSSVLYTLND